MLELLKETELICIRFHNLRKPLQGTKETEMIHRFLIFITMCSLSSQFKPVQWIIKPPNRIQTWYSLVAKSAYIYCTMYSNLKCQKFGIKGRVRTTSVLVRAFWNFKLKVLKHSRNCSLHNTLISWNLKKILNHLIYVQNYNHFYGNIQNGHWT